MKKYFLILSTFYFLLSTSPALAVICNPVLDNCTASTAPVTYTNNVISGVIGIFFIVALIYFFWHLVFAGLHLIGSDGDPKKFQQAGDTITQSVLGLVVVSGAFIIAGLVSRFTGINIINPVIYGP